MFSFIFLLVFTLLFLVSYFRVPSRLPQKFFHDTFVGCHLPAHPHSPTFCLIVFSDIITPWSRLRRSSFIAQDAKILVFLCFVMAGRSLFTAWTSSFSIGYAKPFYRPFTKSFSPFAEPRFVLSVARVAVPRLCVSNRDKRKNSLHHHNRDETCSTLLLALSFFVTYPPFFRPFITFTTLMLTRTTVLAKRTLFQDYESELKPSRCCTFIN